MRESYMGSEEGLTLRSSRGKMIFLLTISLGFVAMGLLMIRKEGGVKPWFVFSFFALCAAVFIVQLLLGASYLRQHAKGFNVCALYRKWPTVLWISTSTFRVGHAGQAMVVFDAEGLGRELLKKLNRGLVGAGCGLPDTYGMKPQALADLMNEWRTRAL
jgi:hypothetical protein